MIQVGAVGLMAVQGFALVPLYLRYIGANAYGAWLASGNIMAWLALVDTGSSALIAQRISEAYGRGNREDLSDRIGTGIAMNLGFGVVLGIAGLAVSPFVPSLVRLGGDPHAHELVVAFALAAGAEAMVIFALTPGAVLMSLMAYPLATGVAYLGCTVLGIGATILFLRAGFGMRSIPLGLLVRAGTLAVPNSVLYYASVVRQFRIRARFSRSELRNVLGLSTFTWLARTGSRVVGNVDAVLIARFIGPGAVATYTLTRRGADLVNDGTWRIGAVIAPALTHVHGQGDTAKLRDVSMRLVRVSVWFGFLGVAGFIALNRSFVAIWVGPSLFGGIGLTTAIALSVAWSSTQIVVSTALFSMGAVRRTSIAAVVEAFTKLILVAVALRMGLGLLGAPIGALLAAVGVGGTLIWLAFTAAVGLEGKVRRAFFASLVLHGLALLGLGLAWSLLVPDAHSWWMLALHGAAFGSIEVLCLAFLSRKFRVELVGLVARIRMKKKVKTS